MGLRIATGVVLAPLVLAVIWLGPVWLVHTLLIAVGAGAVWELTALRPGRQTSGSDGSDLPDRLVTLVFASVAMVAWASRPDLTLEILAALFVLLASVRTFSGRPFADVTRLLAWDAFALLYVGGLLGVAAAGMIGDAGPRSVGRAIFLAFLGVVWLGDTFAYFVGRAIGNTPLAPRLSPKKTIEGALGGLLGSIAGALIVRELFGVPGPLSLLVLFAVAGGVIEQLGDLFQSMLKRASGVKDSGSIFPGHGGVLDRIDGLLFAAPLFALYVRFL